MNFDLESNFDVFLARDMLNTKSFWKWERAVRGTVRLSLLSDVIGHDKFKMFDPLSSPACGLLSNQRIRSMK